MQFFLEKKVQYISISGGGAATNSVSSGVRCDHPDVPQVVIWHVAERREETGGEESLMSPGGVHLDLHAKHDLP
jgi:hypothetical protein